MGIMVSWSIELSKYNIIFVPRSNIEFQVLEDFLVDFSTHIEEKSPCLWFLQLDGSSNPKGSGTSIVLEEPREALLEQPLCFNF